MDDLVKRLREPYEQRQSRRVADEFQAAARIEALEAQVRAADALARLMDQALTDLTTHGGYTYEDDFKDEQAALAAYRATKEGGA